MHDRLPHAVNLARHIRRCCTALVDGAMRAPRRDPAYWLGKFNDHARYWRYPIVTPAVRKDCRALGVTLGASVDALSGVEQLVAFLEEVDRSLRESLLEAPAESCSASVSKDFSPSDYSNTRFTGLSEIFTPLQAEEYPGLSIFLHGSMADLQFTAFSDVDDLIVLHRDAWQDPSSLLRTATKLAQAARAFQRVDPLQHHGHWLLTEFDLLLYDQSYIPLVVLDDAVRVAGASDFACRVSPVLGGFVRNAKNTGRAMSTIAADAAKNGGLNAFRLKELVGQIAIMPAYLFQAHGKMLSKPDAIAEATQLYSAPALRALAWATKVRNEFDVFIDNVRTKVMRVLAELSCARRQHAEAFFRKRAVWVSNRHDLGLNGNVLSAIRAFWQETDLLIARLET